MQRSNKLNIWLKGGVADLGHGFFDIPSGQLQIQSYGMLVEPGAWDQSSPVYITAMNIS